MLRRNTNWRMNGQSACLFVKLRSSMLPVAGPGVSDLMSALHAPDSSPSPSAASTEILGTPQR